ncbi:MAG: hypothetical protein EOP21_11485, partial [Hyphomicrobiales bacterium]
MTQDHQPGAREVIRWWAALFGVLLWFLYVPVQLDLTKANGQRYCARMKAVGQDCNYDYIPVLEVVVIPASVVLAAYFFARFAFGIYAPSYHARRLGWRLAGKIDAAGGYPFLQIIAGIGLCWSLFRLSILPFAFISWAVIVYWILWIMW